MSAGRVKIAIVTQFPIDPARPHGGVEAVSVNLVRALAEFLDLEIHVITLNAEITAAAVSEWEGVRLHRLPRPRGSVLKLATGAGRRAVTEYISKLRPDLIHAHDNYGIMVRGIPVPRVFTVHGFIYGDTLISGGRLPWLRARLWKYVEAGAWADQDHIISISPYVRERVGQYSAARIHDIDNPISARFFEIPRNEIAGTIFSAAVINQRKNTLRLIEACRLLRDGGCNVQLRLAGSVVDREYGEAVTRYIDEHGLHDQVVLLGRLSSDQIQQELARASVFALVSLEENSPMGIEEAMAVGVPVVTSNRCGMPYMVRDGASGFLVDPLDAEDVAYYLSKILQDESLRKNMGDCARKIAEDRFHPRVVAQRTHDVYVDALVREWH